MVYLAGSRFPSHDNEIVHQLIEYTTLIVEGRTDVLWDFYKAHLFKKGIPMPFELPDGTRFMGIIQDVDTNGRLHVMQEDDTIQHFGVKEIRLLY